MLPKCAVANQQSLLDACVDQGGCQFHGRGRRQQPCVPFGADSDDHQPDNHSPALKQPLSNQYVTVDQSLTINFPATISHPFFDQLLFSNDLIQELELNDHLVDLYLTINLY